MSNRSWIQFRIIYTFSAGIILNMERDLVVESVFFYLSIKTSQYLFVMCQILSNSCVFSFCSVIIWSIFCTKGKIASKIWNMTEGKTGGDEQVNSYIPCLRNQTVFSSWKSVTVCLTWHRCVEWRRCCYLTSVSDRSRASTEGHTWSGSWWLQNPGAGVWNVFLQLCHL